MLDRSDVYNDLHDGDVKYIAVTAIDTDGNEIDNIKEDQKIEYGKNLGQIKVEDNLEPGFVAIEASRIVDTIFVNYQKPEFFIDGTAMDDSDISYRAYSEWDCDDTGYCSVEIPTAPKEEIEGLEIAIEDADQEIERVGIIPVIKRQERKNQYNYAFTKELLSP